MILRGYISDATRKFAPFAAVFSYRPDAENKALSLYPDVKCQTIRGFGGAFTESAAHVYVSLSEEKRREAMERLFSPEFAGLKLGRVHIGSCDFCLDSYAYTAPGDRKMKTFSIAHDEKKIIPMIRDAMAFCPELELVASPWSPPAWMKDNASVLEGGRLSPDWVKEWGEYVAHYLLAMRGAGMPITILTVQNEPLATQTWESCRYDAEDEAVVIRDALLPALERHGLTDVKLFIWDHNKERVYDRARDAFKVGNTRQVVDGVAFHWYSGSHFDGLQAVHECFPEKELLETEFCTDIDQHPPEDFDAALLYAEDIAGNLRHWTNGIIDWNLMLDMQGGPYHDREGGCLAPVLVDGDDYRLTGAYWGLCHFSHVIRPGAVRIGASVYDERISCAAAVNPDGSIGCTMANLHDREMPLTIRVEKEAVDIILPAWSLTSVLIK